MSTRLPGVGLALSSVVERGVTSDSCSKLTCPPRAKRREPHHSHNQTAHGRPKQSYKDAIRLTQGKRMHVVGCLEPVIQCDSVSGR